MTEVLGGFYSVDRVTRLCGDLFFVGRRKRGDFGAFGSFLCLLLGTPLGKLFLIHAELGNLRIGLKEPLLD